MNKMLVAAMLAAVPLSSMAASPVGNLDIYYTDSEAELNDGFTNAKVDGDGGFGIRGSGKIADQAFVFGEYQKTDYDTPTDLEIQQIRAGLGFLLVNTEQTEVYGKASFLNFKADSNVGEADDNGWGLHAGAKFKVAPAFSVFGEIGYLDVGDTDGPEYNIGAAFDFSQQFGVVANYRYSDFDVDGGGSLELKDLQLGVRFNF
ncbi:outer membrane beta-barrel protein [Solimonas sp. SE-A11]|uniref:outer membrane beta-barrel protein n=1 Tax=Solimonas sp. SE-A11 TaxID=3054954 RepID=UPI00259D0A01|nr:outer membrane beta-barrel protein [Solimonas sp. SE-A11]MDM4770439.1 outer membrane beta-barrel protein [Solimonas sp. SE-A11]